MGWIFRGLALGFIGLAVFGSLQRNDSPDPLPAPVQFQTVSFDSSSDTGQQHLLPIEKVKLGQRVETGITEWQKDQALSEMSALPSWDQTDIDREHWRKFSLEIQESPGQSLRFQLLRPERWLDEAGERIGAQIEISIPELNISGLANVISIEPCPMIQSGSGQVVTGTFLHHHAEILRLRLSGIDKPLGVTTGHPVYSLDRQGFVPVGQLKIGEALQLSTGTTSVVSIERQAEPESVYNLEIQGDHVYRVTEAGLLVHNAGICGGTNAPDGGLGNPFKNKSAAEIDEMFKKKGFDPRGPDPVGGKGGYVNPETGRSYHIDPNNSYGEPPHVDVNRPKDYRGPLPKKKYPFGGSNADG